MMVNHKHFFFQNKNKNRDSDIENSEQGISRKIEYFIFDSE